MCLDSMWVLGCNGALQKDGVLALVPCISVVPGVKLCSQGPGLLVMNLFTLLTKQHL